MIRWGLALCALGLVGVGMFASGSAGLGSCGPFGAFLPAALLVLFGLIGGILLVVRGVRLGWQRFRPRASERNPVNG